MGLNRPDYLPITALLREDVTIVAKLFALTPTRRSLCDPCFLVL